MSEGQGFRRDNGFREEGGVVTIYNRIRKRGVAAIYSIISVEVCEWDITDQKPNYQRLDMRNNKKLKRPPEKVTCEGSKKYFTTRYQNT